MSLFAVTDRARHADGVPGPDHGDSLLWLMCDEPGMALDFGRWHHIDEATFKEALLAETSAMPEIHDAARNELQKHVTLLVHGYNTDWYDSVALQLKIARALYSGPNSMGTSVLFSWPSNGSPFSYPPDRADAKRVADDLASVMGLLHVQQALVERLARRAPSKSCSVKTSMIAHSMGGFVAQKALATLWTRLNQPLLLSLFNQLVLVAADVDNDLFGAGEEVDRSDGDAMANLVYRITAAYCPQDAVLGMSAGLKHFGKRRLGRSGLDPRRPVPDNVWAIDATQLLDSEDGAAIHSGYFESPRFYAFLRRVLSGLDRSLCLP